jgi:hypothetical protein
VTIGIKDHNNNVPREELIFKGYGHRKCSVHRGLFIDSKSVMSSTARHLHLSYVVGVAVNIHHRPQSED